MYPIILIALWAIPSINRVWTLISPGEDYFPIFIIHSLCLSLTGFANSIAYGLNVNVRREISDSLIRCNQRCRKRGKVLRYA